MLDSQEAGVVILDVQASGNLVQLANCRLRFSLQQRQNRLGTHTHFIVEAIGTAPEGRGSSDTGTGPPVQARSVNLRDCGTIASNLKQGVLFRSSQLLSAAEVRQLHIRSVLDLRAVPQVCQNHVKQPSPGCCPCVVNPFAQPAKKNTQGLRELFIAPPSHCLACSEAFQEEHGHEALVYHASLVDSKLRLFIFGHVPMVVKLRTVLAPAMGTSQEAVMAPAIADGSKLGYGKLYRLILDHSQKEIAKALRVLSQEENLPVLVHCMHGKDRTGMVVMLVLLLCDNGPQAVLSDYVQSELQLRTARDSNQLPLASHLTTDAVVASSADIMQTTMDYMTQKWGSAAGYAQAIGITSTEISRIRMNFRKRQHPKT
ncbi:hypothetical protein ABBQ32_009826 [Trebouxia sp. C0010 RCD-2024]